MKKLIAAVAMGVCGIAVADEYVPVEFIVSTGSQYADTGVRLNPKLSRVNARFVRMEATSVLWPARPLTKSLPS